jgi:acetolactate synthase-1/2/3 large subunit
VFLNGLGRGCLPADHDLAFSRVRARALSEADLALVIGVPMDFRLGFGKAFSPDAEIVVIDAVEPARDHPRPVAVELYGALPATLGALAAQVGSGGSSSVATTRYSWVASLREREDELRGSEATERADMRSPVHPMRLYEELAPLLARDTIVIGDGGDFVSYAGRVVDSFEPGCWLDPGPYGCLGTGPGYALGAKLARPDRDVVLLLGDGAFGFSGMDFDTLARHRVAVVAIMGNNGIWALEKHPMEMIYGYSVAAELRPETPYHDVVAALGGHGELVRSPGELAGAFERSVASGKPALINVLTDPTVAYPRRSNLA